MDEEPIREEGVKHPDLVKKWGGAMDPEWCDVWVDGSGISKIRDKDEKCTYKANSRHLYYGEKGRDYSDVETIACHNCGVQFRVQRL